MFKKTIIILSLTIFNLISCDDKVNIGIMVISGKISNIWSILTPITELFVDNSVSAIILAIDDDVIVEETEKRFGLTAGIPLGFSRSIVQLKQLYNKPVIAFSERNLFGHKYLLTLGADKIMISAAAQAGHIALFKQAFNNYSKNIKNGQVLEVLYAGQYKTGIGENLKPDKNNIEKLQNNIDLNFAQIKDEISNLRPKLKDNQNIWSDAQFYLATESQSNGLVDIIGDKIDLIQYILNTINKPNIEMKNINFVSKIPDNNININPEKKENYYSIIRFKDFAYGDWQITKILLDIFSDSKCSAVILSTNCLGGPTYKYRAIWNEIKKLKLIFNKPVIAYVDTCAISCGYLIATAADYIIAAPGTCIGRIGVRIDKWNNSEKLKHDLIEYIKLGSCNSEYINILDENSILTEQQKTILQKSTDFVYQQFINDIKLTRAKLKSVDQNLWCQAQWFTANEALELGLIDQIGSPMDVVTYINSINNKDIRFEDIEFRFQDLSKAKDKEKKI